MLLWTPAHSHSGCTSSSHAALRLEIYAPPKQTGTPNPELGTASRAHGFAWQNGYGAFRKRFVSCWSSIALRSMNDAFGIEITYFGHPFRAGLGVAAPPRPKAP